MKISCNKPGSVFGAKVKVKTKSKQWWRLTGRRMNVVIQVCVCLCLCVSSGSRGGCSLWWQAGRALMWLWLANSLTVWAKQTQSPLGLWYLQRTIFTSLSFSVSLYVCVCVCTYIYIYIYTHTHTHTHVLNIHTAGLPSHKSTPPLLLNWRPSSWSGLEHCADGHKITNLTDALGLFMDELCSVVMFILLSNFIVLSSLFLSLQLSLFSPSRSILPSSRSPFLRHSQWSRLILMVGWWVMIAADEVNERHMPDIWEDFWYNLPVCWFV